MDLFLHIGTNKTGSSFLQSSLITNKSLLKSLGIYLPDSRWDKEMISGKITPGNGQELAKLMLLKDPSSLKEYLVRLINEAKANNCEKILLSNEILVRLFSDKELLFRFEQTALQVGLNKLFYLTYLRNIYDHALSLFKHRSKYGEFDDYHKWFEEDYETLKLFELTQKNITSSSAEWSFVLYKKKSTSILESLEKWLNIPCEALELFPVAVNRSLTLNQICWLNHYRKDLKFAIPEMYSSLINLSSKCPENNYLLSKFYQVASSYFSSYEKTVNSISLLLTDIDQEAFLSVPIVVHDNFVQESNLLSFDESRVFRQVLEGKGFSRFLSKVIYNFKKKSKLFLSPRRKQKKMAMSKFGGSLRRK